MFFLIVLKLASLAGGEIIYILENDIRYKKRLDILLLDIIQFFRPWFIYFVQKLTRHQKNFLVKTKKFLQKAGTSWLNQELQAGSSWLNQEV